MIKGIIGLALSAMLFALSFSVEAQETKKVPRIGFLGSSSPSARVSQNEAFRQGLRDLGYVEGRNITIEYRWAEGEYDRLPDLAAELVRLNVDIILAQATSAARAAKQATKAIPIVFVGASNPVETGLVASLALPGGNMTGLANVLVDLYGKQLELLKEVLPGVTRVAVLWNPANPDSVLQLKETEAAAQALAVQRQLHEARDANDLDSAFSAMKRERAGAVLVQGDPALLVYRTRLAALAIRGRLPTMSWTRSFAEAGGLMAYGPSQADMNRRAAVYVDKILKGAKPAALPVEQPMKFELVINLKTAKQIGVTIPQSVLYRADKVIK